MICVTDHSTRHGRFKPPSFESLWDSSDSRCTRPQARTARSVLSGCRSALTPSQAVRPWARNAKQQFPLGPRATASSSDGGDLSAPRGGASVEAAAVAGDLLGLEAAAATSWPVAGGEDGAKSAAPNGRACPRPRSPAVRKHAARHRRRGRSRAPDPGRGARRGRRPTSRPQAAGRRAKRRGDGASRSRRGGCSGLQPRRHGRPTSRFGTVASHHPFSMSPRGRPPETRSSWSAAAERGAAGEGFPWPFMGPRGRSVLLVGERRSTMPPSVLGGGRASGRRGDS